MGADRSGIGHGKLLLFGEHAAVYGHPACGLTLPGSVRVRIRETASPVWRIARNAGGGGAAWGLDRASRSLLADFLREAESLFPAQRRRGEILIESDLPISRGFGSSAAWCVAFTRALLGEEATLEEVWKVAHRAEGFFHGTPSGIDTGLAILDGLFAFAPAPPALPGARRLAGFPLHLLVGALPRAGSTRELVGGLKRRIEAGDAEATAIVERLASLSASAIDLLDSADASRVGELGRLAVDAQRELARLDLSTPALDALLAAGADEGALGGKLSGAGGGGAYFLLFNGPEEAERALPRLRLLARPLEPEPILFRYSWSPGSLQAREQ